MKVILNGFLLMIFSSINAQNVTFNGCHPLFDNQDYAFTLENTDSSGRNIYKTSPVDGNQPCGGLGTCEFRIIWSAGNARWEFVADSGNGDFVNPYIIYYNMAASTPNPPNLTLGTWVENGADTGSNCGGNLNSGNAILTGGVQSTILGITDFAINNGIVLYPNPTSNLLSVATNSSIENLSVWNILGQEILSSDHTTDLDVSGLKSGAYIIRVRTPDGLKVANFIKK
ncbi:T9SS type A sorting domain-containing protein [Flavobacterium sp. GT3R68]|uniref:T9SS type A sorting domain-containing protein n=1 Tax=Flavobacterium sp. GT3R68 TaxID=2594437 RepID=UPI000F8859AE|nr:T9SS type A sorting domain-containing protein [Flavobacterium sp. GT3R68]RTY90044.1 T9SS type A sorting domain-containing protein [Flavobacterium sp. GSN2]TRW93367.1 T9SS type A sorting domain-containing protein [Flavobacterium sp. GT3R68]